MSIMSFQFQKAFNYLVIDKKNQLEYFLLERKNVVGIWNVIFTSRQKKIKSLTKQSSIKSCIFSFEYKCSMF